MKRDDPELRSKLRLMLLTNVLVLAFTLPGAVRADDSVPVHKLMQFRARWPDYANARKQMTIEGRYASLVNKVLKLDRCDLKFVPSPRLAAPRVRPGNLSIVGRFGLQSGVTVFIVDRLRTNSDDLTRLRKRKEALADSSLADWCRAARNFMEEARFYEDTELMAAAREMLDSGLSQEREKLTPNDADALRQLADRAGELQLGDGVKQELIHESLWLRWNELNKTKPSDEATQRFITLLSSELGGTRTPLQKPNAALRNRYLSDADAVYRAADAATRKVLHREFFVEINLKRLMLGAKPDFSNGNQIARQIEDLIPERSDVADTQRAGWMESRIISIPTMGRTSLVQLTAELRKAERFEEVRGLVEQWMKSREAQLRDEGPEALLELAADYKLILGDDEKAIDVAQQACEEIPESDELRTELDRIGLILTPSGLVQSKRGRRQQSSDAITQAKLEGRILEKMSPKDVISVKGEPQHVIRIATQGSVALLWVYGPGKSVYFVTDPGTQALQVAKFRE